MSKKRKLNKRIKASQRKKKVRSGCDCHHIFFQKRHWRGGLKGEFRMYWYNRVYIPRDTLHREIHEFIAWVPIPRTISIRDAMEQLRMLEKYGGITETDPIEKRLKVLIALFECCEEPTAEALRKQLEIVERFYKPS